jgi:uncharacterized protein (TIGR04255 family)
MPVRYEKAPISEALIDIRVDPSVSLGIETLESLQDAVKDSYPTKTKRLFFQGQFSVGEEAGAVATQNLLGFAFASQDGKQIFQARTDGFTFSRLRPYGTWLELRDESKRLWAIYRTTLSSVKVTRMAVRYINQIDIPMPFGDYREYFLTTPEVAADLPQQLNGFFMQLQFPQPDFGGTLILTQTPLPPTSPEIHSVILDLDVFRFETELISEDQLWASLEILRDRKNLFFEGCITDKTRQLFGKKEEY